MAESPRCAVITVSSSRAAGSGAADGSGDAISAWLDARSWPVVQRALVADDIAAIQEAVRSAHAELVVLTGGTGLAAGDVTPEALRPLLERELPGMGEAMRAAGLAKTPHAMLSRQVAGVMGRTLVLALPGSPAACEDSLNAVGAALPHALGLLRGDHG